MVIVALVSVIKLTTLRLTFMQDGKYYLNFCNKSETLKSYLHISWQLRLEFVTNVKTQT
jgi:hypothetical protein